MENIRRREMKAETNKRQDQEALAMSHLYFESGNKISWKGKTRCCDE
jgi:hypothetical protein